MTVIDKQSIQGPIFGPILFSIFISDLHNDMVCNIRKALNGTKLGGMADPSGQLLIQRDLRK